MKICTALVVLGSAIWLDAPVIAQAAELPATDADGRHDFDFLIGSWNIANRMLKPGSKDEWMEFTSTTSDTSFIDGLGNMDEMTLPKNRHGISLRFFDPTKKLWSIYWAASPTGVLQVPPVVGRFANGVGNFYCDDVDTEGKPVKVHYMWTHPSANEAQWNMAVSRDGGMKWGVTWAMHFTRLK